MGRRSNNQAIDKLCRDWGKTRRQLLGLSDPILAKEYIGSLRSTLGERRDLHACSKSNKLDLHWPEVYEGESRFVNAAHKRLSPHLQFVMDLQYAAHVDPTVKADILCVSVATFWVQVSSVRQFVDGFLSALDAARAA
jgi:hypothetical protein